MEIRLAQVTDLLAILAISNHYARTTIANFAIEPETIECWRASFDATHETHPWLVSEDTGGAIVGFAKASPWKGRCAYDFACEITAYIAPGHHGRGLGRALYEQLFAILRAQGYRSLLAGIALPNDASVRLHEAMGMKRIACFERIGFKFGTWHDVAFWRVQLVDDDTPPLPILSVSEALTRIAAARVSSS